MNITWFCNFADCKHPKERTSSHVLNISHTHNKVDYELIPYKKPMKPRGVETPKSLKKKVWDLFSEYVRRVNSDDQGYCECVTCGKRDLWKNMQAGHYLSRKHSGTFIDVCNVHVQCDRCNILLHGNMIAYNTFMVKTYGQKTIDRLEYMAKRRHSFTVFELQQYQKRYTQILEGLK